MNDPDAAEVLDIAKQLTEIGEQYVNHMLPVYAELLEALTAWGEHEADQIAPVVAKMAAIGETIGADLPPFLGRDHVTTA